MGRGHTPTFSKYEVFSRRIFSIQETGYPVMRSYQYHTYGVNSSPQHIHVLRMLNVESVIIGIIALDWEEQIF